MSPDYTNLTPQQVGHKAAELSVSVTQEALTADRLRELLAYDADTGLFTWLVNRQRARAGDVAGSILNTGYVRIVIDQQKYFAHRLAFLYMDGCFPDVHVDHIDGSRKNNRWANLRKATHAENLCNTSLRADNKSGVKGVSWSRKMNKWKAQIVANGKPTTLGYFDTIEEAAEVYRTAGKKSHGDFFNDGTEKRRAA